MPSVEPLHLPIDMKSQFQILSFLTGYTPKSSLDLEMISSFLEKHFKIAPKNLAFSSNEHSSTIDAQAFLQWLNDGYGASDIARHNNTLVILGTCTIDTVTIIGTLSDNRVQICNTPTPVSELSPATAEEINTLEVALFHNNLQFNQETQTLSHKYIPSINEKVIFHSNDFSIKGLGVVRNVYTDTKQVVLYCYFIYPGPKNDRQIGYSMYEDNVVNLHEHIFEPMLEDPDNNRFSKLNGVSCLRRLNTELAKHSKVWKDKIHRIEPCQCKAEKGGKYWYINDKMSVVQDTEKETPTSHMRYLAGNYFIDQTSAVKMLGKIRDMLQSYLASPTWPNMEN